MSGVVAGDSEYLYTLTTNLAELVAETDGENENLFEENTNLERVTGNMDVDNDGLMGLFLVIDVIDDDDVLIQLQITPFIGWILC